MSAIIETRAQAAAEYRHKMFDELAEAEQKSAGIAQDLLKSERKAKLQILTAPWTAPWNNWPCIQSGRGYPGTKSPCRRTSRERPAN